MIIKYINETAFGNYKTGKVSKEDRIATIKKRTSEIIVKGFIDSIREYVYDSIKRISYIYDTTFIRLYLECIDDKDSIYFNIDNKTNRIIVGVPMVHYEKYAVMVSNNNFNGNFSIFKFLDHVNNSIKNSKEVQAEADKMFGENNYTFETKIYLLENNIENLKINCTEENECIDFFRAFINLKFNLKTLQISNVYCLVQGRDKDLSKLEAYSEFIKSEYVLFTGFPRYIKSLHGIENLYSPNKGNYQYNTSIKFVEDKETVDLSTDEIKILAKHFTWGLWYPFSKELILELYGTEENFYKTFLQEARFLYAIDGHEPEDDVEKAEIYLTGLKEFSSVSFDYENGKVTSDVIIDNY